MLKEEKVPKPPIPTFWRSVSWTERSPSNPNPRSQPGGKPRSCLPPLSISRRRVEEWPQAGSDDIGEWANGPATPGVKPKPKPNPNPVESNADPPPLRDAQANKDKECCSRIADHIYLGSEAVAKNREILRQNGITHVLNCVGFACPEYFKSDLVYKTLWLQDTPSEDITSILYDVFDYFEEVREMGGRVLVHCCQGISRSTSLVIAYLMWRDGQSFDDAFQFVKSARGVTNPNIGFACQLLQCQKRVHAVPVSPSSVLRMYRMAPHSPYDPLHVVPKMLTNPGTSVLDSRGAFIVHVPSAIYVWIGKHCSVVMAHNARASASQVVRYERVQGPIVIVEEGLEPGAFWDALVIGPNFDSDKGKEGLGDWPIEKGQVLEEVMRVGVGGKKVEAFDIDFDIFEKALSGGVVPPFPYLEAGGETQVPARESGWYRLRKKFTCGLMKEIKVPTKLADDISPPREVGGEIMDTYKGTRQPSISSDDALLSRMSSSNLSYSSSDCSSTRPTSISNSPAPSPPLSVGCALHEVLDGCVGAVEPSVSSTYPLSSAFLCSTSSFDSFSLKKMASSCTESSQSLAERRGSVPPTLMLYPSINDPTRVLPRIGRSWSFSHYSSLRNMMVDGEINQFESVDFSILNKKARSSYSNTLSARNVIIARMALESRFGKIHLEPNGLFNGGVNVEHAALFRWPTFEKVDMSHIGILDSRSVFLLLATNENLVESESKILYIWVGHEANVEIERNQGMERHITSNDGNTYWKQIGINFLSQMRLPMITPLQVVQEGKEPMQFLDYFKRFSAPQLKVSSIVKKV
ncbi:hypothetical protein Sjap_023471 [Stephania japonica]|uniref:Uncharacterized protein n=1 Tax=Stephania japonica TaxID=461633 RepID=A0AAP0EK45_9MAGN